jgi:hypothetical protein
MCLGLPATLGPWAYSALIKNEYVMQKKCLFGVQLQPARKADNLTTFCISYLKPAGLH